MHHEGGSSHALRKEEGGKRKGTEEGEREGEGGGGGGVGGGGGGGGEGEGEGEGEGFRKNLISRIDVNIWMGS